MAATKRELRRRGYPQADIELAERQRAAEQRAGSHPRSLEAILHGKPAKARSDAPFADLTARQLRARGRYGQAALLADQEALTERDPDRAMIARKAAFDLKALARKPTQIEFDFFLGGNVSMSLQFLDAVRERLMAADITPAERAMARSVLLEIARWVGWQEDSRNCAKTAAELADLLGLDAANMARTLQLLESVRAIARVKRGRTKVIIVNPEGLYRGDLTRHAEAVDRYRAEVIPLRQHQPPEPEPAA